ncbi:biorientation of chromosomes in cell division protein 1-like 1 isoform X2 [Bacillus rossius redtenbacheri]|uniref:biorientation of chromosomes in cell division protein 1-like 1 isoform X2 n=1 Tax=Bacillus rossius redtenbacheri TaxID=93214 RepID=UPI002FDE641B
MDASETNYPPGDPRLIDKIVYQLKSQGIFDQFRKECMADVDTKPAYQNLHQRVEASVSTFLAGVEWKPDLSKNQLRENLRKHINESGFLEIGVERIVDQVVNPKIRTVFLPHVEEVVYSFLGLERPRQTKPVTNTSMFKSQMNDPPSYEESKQSETKMSPLSALLPQDLKSVSPESDTCELTLKHQETVEMEFSDGGTFAKDRKVEEDTSPAFEPLLDENSNGSHISGMSGFSSHDEGQLSPTQQSVSQAATTPDKTSQLDRVEKMEVETSCKGESETGADKVSSTVEENVLSPAQVLTHNMSALEIQEPVLPGDRLAVAKDEKCDSSMDIVRNEKNKESDKEKDSRKREKTDGKSSKSRSDSKDKYKSSDRSKHDSKEKKIEKEKAKHEESKSRSKSEPRKDKESGSKKEKVSDGKKDKVPEVKKDKKMENSKSEHKDGGSKKEKDSVSSRKEKEHESRRDKDSDKKHDKDGDKKKDSDRDKSKSDDRSKSKHDDKTKDRNKSDTKHGRDGKDKSQSNKDDKHTKSAEKKSKSSSDQKSRDGEKKDSKEKSSVTHRYNSDETERKDSDKKGRTSMDHTVSGDDKLLTDGDSIHKGKDKSKKGRSQIKTPDDLQSTDGESDTRSRDSYRKTSKRHDDQASTDGESDGEKQVRKSGSKGSTRQQSNEDGSENGEGEDGSKKRKQRPKGVPDDHHAHRSRRDHDRRSADRDSSGAGPQPGGGQAQRQGRASRQESSSPRKGGKTGDTSSSATDAIAENQDTEASPSSLPFKKRPLQQDAESEEGENDNSRLHEGTVLPPSGPREIMVVDLAEEEEEEEEEEVISITAPKQIEKQKLGEIEKSLRSEVGASLASDLPNCDSKRNGILQAIDEDEDSDVQYFMSCDDSIFDDRDRQYINALRKLSHEDLVPTKSNEDDITICAVSQCFDEFAKTADELGIKVVKTLQDIQVYSTQVEAQEPENSLQEMLRNRRYVVRLSDDVKGFKNSPKQDKTEVEVVQPSVEAPSSAELNSKGDSTRTDTPPDHQGVYRSASDEDVSCDAPLSSDMILPSLQDLMRESGMVPSPNAGARPSSCRRVGLPRPSTRKSDSSVNPGGACVDKKNGMSSDRRMLRSSVGDSQRYSSEDLYKPRPLFSHGSRRNRHNSEEQAAGEVQSCGVKRSISEDSNTTVPPAKKRR